MNPVIKGLHHITAITSDATEAVRFYTQVLGLRLVKKTVNFDDPTAYHLYFGDKDGNPGTILTFFDWGTSISHGSLGLGVPHHLAYKTQNIRTLVEWKTRLERLGVPTEGPFNRQSYSSIYLLDPDGLVIEIATPRDSDRSVNDGPSELGLFSKKASQKNASKETPDISPEMQLQGLHHATALVNGLPRLEPFYTEILGFKPLTSVKNSKSQSYAFQFEDESEGFLSFLQSDTALTGLVGIGTVHHIAMAVDDEEEQSKWRDKLLDKHVKVTPVLDRKYFKSIYFREPNGVLLEIATLPPGFTVDERFDRLGESLTLPEWLETRRPLIEASLRPIAT